MAASVEECSTRAALFCCTVLGKEECDNHGALEYLTTTLREEYGLGDFGLLIVQKWLKKMALEPRGLERLRDWFLLLMNKGRGRQRIFNPWQWGCPDLIPGLQQKGFWDELPGVKDVAEACFQSIREELLSNRTNPLFQPYRAPNWVSPDRVAKDGIGSLGHDSGDWNVCYLYLHNVDFSSNCQQFPKTVEMIKSLPRWYCHAFFSVLAPNTHVAKHNGPTNKKLRIHLPLVVPPGAVSGLRVGEEQRVFEEGKCIIFDDSFEHEAFNLHPSESRICLIFDVWHPDLQDREVNLLSFLEKGKMKKAKQLCENQGHQFLLNSDWEFEKISNNGCASPRVTQDGSQLLTGNNFYALLEHTTRLAQPLSALAPPNE